MSWLLWVVLLPLAYFVAQAIIRASGATSTGGSTAPSAAPRLRGNGRFSVEVVGESFYRPAFLAICGSRAGSEDELHRDAVLDLATSNPHDSQAVAVLVEGRQVGNLSRDMARDFRAALQRDGIAGPQRYSVACRIYCGGPDELFSVTLDLPEA